MELHRSDEEEEVSITLRQRPVSGDVHHGGTGPSASTACSRYLAVPAPGDHGEAEALDITRACLGQYILLRHERAAGDEAPRPGYSIRRLHARDGDRVVHVAAAAGCLHGRGDEVLGRSGHENGEGAVSQRGVSRSVPSMEHGDGVSVSAAYGPYPAATGAPAPRHYVEAEVEVCVGKDFLFCHGRAGEGAVSQRGVSLEHGDGVSVSAKNMPCFFPTAMKLRCGVHAGDEYRIQQRRAGEVTDARNLTVPAHLDADKDGSIQQRDGQGHQDPGVGVAIPQGAGHGEENPCDAQELSLVPVDVTGTPEGEYRAYDIFLTQRRNGYGYWIDALKYWVLRKLGLVDYADDIPLKWSWANIMGPPVYQSGDGDGSCVICACMTCIHAQHRLAFERRHGAGSFQYELCQAGGVMKVKLYCLLSGIWTPTRGSEPPKVLQMMKMLSVGLDLRGVPDCYLSIRSYGKFSMKNLKQGGAVILLRLGGPMIGSLYVCPQYFISTYDPDYVYRGVPGMDVPNHAVVCVAYKFVVSPGELHIQVLDNHTVEGPLRWIQFEAFSYFTCIGVDPLTPEELPVPRTSRVRNIFSFWNK